MKTRAAAFWSVVAAIAAAIMGIGGALSQDSRGTTGNIQPHEASVDDAAQKLLAQGRRTFRSDTFGDEAFWGGTLRLHEAIAGAANGGVGPGLSPEAALALGLKVDVAALPPPLQAALRRGRVDLTRPATTLALLRLDAVVGVRGFFDDTGQQLRSVGITCALCHSDVDDSFAPGIGERLDGWAARDLDVGSIIALAPNLQPFVDLLAIVHPGITADDVRAVLHSWGPGKFDAELILDGKTTGPEGAAATLIPPAFGLAGVNLHTWTGWGSVTHWNAFVANLEMQGQGTFFDPRLEDAAKFPIAAAAGFGDVRRSPDRITPKLAALHFYQLALIAPRPAADAFNPAAAARGKALFSGPAQCARCHVPPLFTEPGWNMHTPAEIGIDSFQADRSPDERYRTAPLKGLWTHTKGGFYHDGRFAELTDVIEHYDAHFGLGLSAQDKADLAEYLMSL
jgi:mono/diheme cytochrome c family protein